MSDVFMTRTNYGGRKLTLWGWLVLAAGLLAMALSATMLILWISFDYLPEKRLNRAEIEKRILVEQARAERDSAVFQAEGEVNRAKGVAESNRIIADSITEPYLRYHYINTLSSNQQNVIYIPTEAGLPILEAGRRP